MTTPLPLPLPPELIVIQLALLTAVHTQAVVVVTFTLPGPPVASNDRLMGERVKVQPPDAPDWVTVNVSPAIVIVPIREVVPGFVATE